MAAWTGQSLRKARTLCVAWLLELSAAPQLLERLSHTVGRDGGCSVRHAVTVQLRRGAERCRLWSPALRPAAATALDTCWTYSSRACTKPMEAELLSWGPAKQLSVPFTL